MADNSTVIATIPKNKTENVVVSLSEFNGHHLLDVRVFAAFVQGDEPKPTKKGISIAIGRLPALIDALRDAEAEARRRGLLTTTSVQQDD